MKAGWANPATEVLIKLYCTHVMPGDRLAARLPTLDLDDKKFGRPEAVSKLSGSELELSQRTLRRWLAW
jgi:hypothetical protein